MADQPTNRRAFSDDEYTTVVQKAQLNSIRLIDSRFNIRPEILKYNSEKMAALLKFGYGIDAQNFHYGEDYALIQVRCEMTAKKGNTRLVYCTALYVVNYDALAACNAAAVESFARRVSTFAVYPYFRALFSTYSSEAGLNIPMLPILKSEPAKSEKQPKSKRRSQEKPSKATAN